VRLGPAHFAHDYASGLQSHTSPKTIEHRHTANGQKFDVISHGALEFRRVLDRNDPIVGCYLGHHIKHGVHERGLPGTGGTHGQNVLFTRHGCADNFRMAPATNIVKEAVPLAKRIQGIILARKNSSAFILGHRKYFLRPQSNGEHRTAHDGRDETFETTAIKRQFRL
jgi:hypothetical protein